MTRSDLRQRLQNHFDNNVYYTDSDLNESMQDGIDEIAAFTGCCYGVAAIPFQAGKTYYDILSLIPNYIGVIAIFNKALRRWMAPTSLRRLNSVRYDWDCVAGTPEFFTPINHRYIAIMRKPLADGYGNMIVFYRAAAPILTDTTEIPIPVPERVRTLEQYSICDLWEQAQEWGKANTAFSEYSVELDSLRITMRNRRNSDRLMSLKGDV